MKNIYWLVCISLFSRCSEIELALQAKRVNEGAICSKIQASSYEIASIVKEYLRKNSIKNPDVSTAPSIEEDQGGRSMLRADISSHAITCQISFDEGTSSIDRKKVKAERVVCEEAIDNSGEQGEGEQQLSCNQDKTSSPISFSAAFGYDGADLPDVGECSPVQRLMSPLGQEKLTINDSFFDTQAAELAKNATSTKSGFMCPVCHKEIVGSQLIVASHIAASHTREKLFMSSSNPTRKVPRLIIPAYFQGTREAALAEKAIKSKKGRMCPFCSVTPGSFVRLLKHIRKKHLEEETVVVPQVSRKRSMSCDTESAKKIEIAANDEEPNNNLIIIPQDNSYDKDINSNASYICTQCNAVWDTPFCLICMTKTIETCPIIQQTTVAFNGVQQCLEEVHLGCSKDVSGYTIPSDILKSTQAWSLAKHAAFDGCDYHCPCCAIKEKHQIHLIFHIIESHTKEKPYVCDYPGCCESFSRYYGLNRHIKSAHNDGV